MLDLLMRFFDLLYRLCLDAGNPLLGWMLHLPRNLVLFVVALGTALTLTVVRLFTTNQKHLKRCKNDKARLKELLREAKKKGDKDAVARYRTTIGQIGMVGMKAEALPLVVSLVPIAILATWCWANIAYVPPKPGQPVEVKVYCKPAAIGELIHMVPQEGVTAENGWIRKIEAGDVDKEGSIIEGIAVWKLQCAPAGPSPGSDAKGADSYLLKIRCAGQTVDKELKVDGLHYADPVLYPGGDGPIIAVELKMDEFKLFDLVPGIKAIGLQPWMAGYLMIVFPLAFLLKPVLRIH